MSTPDNWPGLVPRPPQGETDPRFTVGLVFDVSEVLAEHGYPQMADWPQSGPVELQQGLFAFLYGSSDPT